MSAGKAFGLGTIGFLGGVFLEAHSVWVFFGYGVWRGHLACLHGEGTRITEGVVLGIWEVVFLQGGEGRNGIKVVWVWAHITSVPRLPSCVHWSVTVVGAVDRNLDDTLVTDAPPDLASQLLAAGVSEGWLVDGKPSSESTIHVLFVGRSPSDRCSWTGSPSTHLGNCIVRRALKPGAGLHCYCNTRRRRVHVSRVEHGKSHALAPVPIDWPQAACGGD